jgi:hypothetical protein
MSNHPIPWFVEESTNRTWLVKSADNRPVGRFDRREDAERIVTAVNEYEASLVRQE